MIVGLGTDIVEVERVARMIADHGDHFLERVFTPGEIAHCSGRRESAPHYAGRWAAKEAVLKCGWAGLLQPQHVEIVFGSEGQPTVVFMAAAQSLARDAGRGAIDADQHSISISHTRGIAVAVCVRVV